MRAVYDEAYKVVHAYDPRLWVRPKFPAQRNVPFGGAAFVPLAFDLIVENKVVFELQICPVNSEMQDPAFVPLFALALLAQLFQYIREVHDSRKQSLRSLSKQLGELAEVMYK